jgi:hypothetical protein
MADTKNFFASLFDVSFKEFVTPRMISFIFILSIVVLGLFSLGWLVMSLWAGQWWAIIAAPLGFIIYLIFIRMWLEMFMVFFRIMNKVEEIADGKQSPGQAPSGSAPPTPPTPVA